MDDSRLVVGAPGADAGKGLVFVTPRPSLVGTTILAPPDGVVGSEFGAHVDADGARVVVGAPGDVTDGQPTGAAYVFDAAGAATKIEAPRLVAEGEFGGCVALSGDVLAIGAPFHPAVDYDPSRFTWGAVYVFEANNDSYSQVAELRWPNASGDLYTSFGERLALDGDTLVVSLRQEKEEGGEKGAAVVFERDAGAAGAWGQTAVLSQSTPAENDRFGQAIALEQDVLAIGSPGCGAGRVFIYQRAVDDPFSWIQASDIGLTVGEMNFAFGSSVALAGDLLVVEALEGQMSASRWAVLRRGSSVADWAPVGQGRLTHRIAATFQVDASAGVFVVGDPTRYDAAGGVVGFSVAHLVGYPAP